MKVGGSHPFESITSGEDNWLFLADDYKEDKKKRQNQIERPPLNSKKKTGETYTYKSTEAGILSLKTLSGTQER